MRILIVGIGNKIYSDDGFGPAVLERLSKDKNLSPNVKLLTVTAGLDILFELKEGKYGGLIIVDIIDNKGRPGDLYLVKPEFEMKYLTKYIEGKRIYKNLHEMDLANVLTLAKKLGILPKRAIIVGCQPKSITLGLKMTEEVERAVDKAIMLIKKKIKEWEELK